MKLISKNNTAILVFARSSQEEVAYKKIRKGRLLFETLNRHTLQTVKDTGLPFFHITEQLQEGVTFGERFSNAIQKVLDKGYDRIVTVGNDSPHLTKNHILKALNALAQKKLVLGPSADGGFYLMGLHKADFRKASFEKLSWQTSTITDEVRCLLSSNDETQLLLPQLVDIDSYWDVSLISDLALGLKKAIIALVLALVQKNKKVVTPIFLRSGALAYQTPFNKGSPQISFSK